MYLKFKLTFYLRKYYYPGDAYAKSKLAQVYFTKHLQTILKEKNLKIQVHACHPGIVNTDLFEHSSNTYIPWFKDIFYKVKLFSAIENPRLNQLIKFPETGSW